MTNNQESEIDDAFEQMDKMIDERMKGWTSLSVRDDLKSGFREHTARVIQILTVDASNV